MATGIFRSNSFAFPTRRFYIAASSLTVVIAFVGFWPTYFGPLFHRTVAVHPIIHFHAAVYVGWLALFIAQAALAATGRIRQHRALGRIGIGYGVIVILVGLLVTFHRFDTRIDELGLEESLGFLTWPLIDMVIFTPVFALAVVYRGKPEIHKRLMVVATTTLLIAPAGRVMFLGSLLPWPLILTVWYSPVLLGLAYDLLKKRLIHPVYVAGLGVLYISSFRDVLMQSDLWVGFARWLGTSFV
jgi:uncharacterized membrane protein YozB (DUF420 family)